MVIHAGSDRRTAPPEGDTSEECNEGDVGKGEVENGEVGDEG